MAARTHWVDLSTREPEPIPEGGTLADRLRAAGVGAARVTSPDLVAQIESCTGVDLLIVHALDGGRRTHVRRRWALRNKEPFALGVRSIQQHVGPRRTLVVADTRWRAFRGIVADADLDARVARVRDVYPQQHPTALLWSLAGRRLRPGELPTAVRAIVIDAVAAVEAGDAALGRTVARRPVAVWDHRGDTPDVQLAVADAGTPIDGVLKRLDVPAATRVLVDDFQRQDARPVEGLTLDGSAAVLHVPPPPTGEVPQACVRCGWCLDVCPTHLNPVALLEAGQRRDAAAAERFHVGGCLECGLCDTACPSALPILQGIRAAKAATEGRA